MREQHSERAASAPMQRGADTGRAERTAVRGGPTREAPAPIERGREVPPQPVRAFVVADVALYREGVAQALARCAQVRVVGTAPLRDDLVEAVRAAQPNVVLLDMSGPEGLAAARALAADVPDARIIALAVAESAADIIACAEAGISGYVPLDGSLDDLVAAVASVRRGELLCSPRVAALLLRQLAARASERPSGASDASLTGREREIARLLERGLSNKEIAKRLGIEVATVKNHVHNILEKLQVSRRWQAAARLRLHGARTGSQFEAPMPRAPGG